MEEEIFFAGISLAVTCLLLKLRHWVVGDINHRAINVRLDSHIVKAGLDDSSDEWPSEITIPAEFFTRQSL